MSKVKWLNKDGNDECHLSQCRSCKVDLCNWLFCRNSSTIILILDFRYVSSYVVNGANRLDELFRIQKKEERILLFFQLLQSWREAQIVTGVLKRMWHRSFLFFCFFYLSLFTTTVGAHISISVMLCSSLSLSLSLFLCVCIYL